MCFGGQILSNAMLRSAARTAAGSPGTKSPSRDDNTYLNSETTGSAGARTRNVHVHRTGSISITTAPSGAGASTKAAAPLSPSLLDLATTPIYY